jgi:streptogramin lyase
MQPRYAAIAAAIIFLMLLPIAVIGAPGDLSVEEAGLGSDVARPRQVNLAPDGALLVSIDVSSQIRRINPQTGAYTAYTNANALVSPIDARADNQDNIWFADWTMKTLGRISANALTTWPLPNAGAPWGTALDDAGRVWVADLAAPYLFRIQPGTNRVCRYALPDAGISEHVVFSGGKLWLGDNANGRILRVTPLTTFDRIQVESWPVPPAGAKSSFPSGLAADGDGNLWWADNGLGTLARLEPSANRMTGFAPPAGTAPLMLTFAGDGLWYTEEGQNTVGLLDPALAAGQATTLTPGSLRTVTPTCLNATPGQFTITASSGNMSWTANNWTIAAAGGGWTVYQMPTGADPYGVVALPDAVWVADLGRHKVARFEYVAPATRTPTATPTGATSTPTATATEMPAETATPTATATATAAATATATATATRTATPSYSVYLPLITR